MYLLKSGFVIFIYFYYVSSYKFKKNIKIQKSLYYLTHIIHEISFMQMQGDETRRYIHIFRGFCNKADA
ncbi:MAG: hypothetical protein DRI94_10515 [Bacteroidetes bacterium]|nr:MAG: hypothetical protein DRI94_10515 [Bacteroidota bacterium]